MNIGEAAKASGVSAKMIRYYEETGLIAPPERSPAGYRTYEPSEIHTLTFIRSARNLGFSMEEIAELLALWRDRERPRREVKRIVEAHIGDLEARIRALQDMAGTLRHLADACGGDDRPDCPILKSLAAPEPDTLPDPPAPHRFGAI
ncbi:Cu(I)-responsive transcriptional regulator [Antarcticirhabdus aurantiaca]|uniref:Cu(I)-responsive transcriptional regulator n=1 Tax=Antarcticirhabdus aurantiaca TaxID=2606717 RepID=A0ACD4NPP8_9HYPH|nr:Cu(I)-responsive transcriptional regulator [Antarcticirhabdus aurantiaca]WAJ28754.1 Cu(I)-responsive transcriptional regulator [Jeongeuplla avenae]